MTQVCPSLTPGPEPLQSPPGNQVLPGKGGAVEPEGLIGRLRAMYVTYGYCIRSLSFEANLYFIIERR